MTRRDADVIVVGAGPAGAVTAVLLARAGRDVLLLDRASFPRAKPCGDCLSVAAAALLQRLGILEPLLAAPHARLDGWRIVAPDGTAFQARFGRADSSGRPERSPRAFSGAARAISVERCVLDALLLDAAVAAGARLEQLTVTDIELDQRRHVIGVRTRAGVRRAPITIGADGLRSVVAKRLGARTTPGSLRKLSLTFHLAVRHAGIMGEMHVGDGICAGVAPVDAHGLCNLTIVADAVRFGRAVAADAHAFAHAALDTLPLARDRVSEAALRAAAPLASGPFDRPVRRVAFDGAVLVGDAAGYYDPFTGQGVYQALASAELLAPSVDHALERGDTRAAAFSRYARARAALMRGPRRVQRGIEAVLCQPARANRALARIQRAPAFGRAILAVTGDVEPAYALLAPRALASLLLPALPPENAA